MRYFNASHDYMSKGSLECHGALHVTGVERKMTKSSFKTKQKSQHNKVPSTD